MGSLSNAPCWLCVVSVFNFPCAGWVGFFLLTVPPCHSSEEVWCLPFGSALVCLPTMGSPQTRVTFWLAFGRSEGEFPSRGRVSPRRSSVLLRGSSCGWVRGTLVGALLRHCVGFLLGHPLFWCQCCAPAGVNIQ